MQGVVEQINVSRGGVPKHPILRAAVHRLGIEGDDHAHPRFHGGPTRALLLIAAETIQQLTAEGFSVYPGALGENLTTRGLDPKQMRVGQRFRAGSVVLELTQVRVPCSQLDPYGAGIQQALYDKRVKAGDPSSPVWGRSGFYASIVQPGEIHPQDIIVLIDQAV